VDDTARRAFSALTDGGPAGPEEIAIVPTWDDEKPLTEGLPAFPGRQVLMIIPAQQAE
jgi:hypothetical protein